MVFLYSVFLVGCLGLLTAGIVEQRRHYANLEAIPHRVLVNGIRGKSSITRLCAGDGQLGVHVGCCLKDGLPVSPPATGGRAVFDLAT